MARSPQASTVAREPNRSRLPILPLRIRCRGRRARLWGQKSVRGTNISSPGGAAQAITKQHVRPDSVALSLRKLRRPWRLSRSRIYGLTFGSELKAGDDLLQFEVLRVKSPLLSQHSSAALSGLGTCEWAWTRGSTPGYLLPRLRRLSCGYIRWFHSPACLLLLVPYTSPLFSPTLDRNH
jgi:hypothetical protein